MADTPSGVMVYCPLEKQGLAAAAKELLGEGAALAAALDEDLFAAALGPGAAALAAEAGSLGVRRLFCADDPALEFYTAPAYAAAMERVVQAANPSILLVSATVQGRDLAARLAARLGTGLTADCTELQVSPENRLLLQTRPAYGGNVIATIVCAERRPQMATVRPGVFKAPQPDYSAPPARISPVPVPETGFDAARITAAQRRPPEDDVLSRAEVVVSCGRGIKNKAGLSLATELANALGGVVGGSRGAVEDGLIPRNAQVGQTGRTVRPRLYIACGISGAAQHIAGMRQAGCVIAINTDPDAPVFKEADFGICADVFEALPKLIDMAINNTITRGGIK